VVGEDIGMGQDLRVQHKESLDEMLRLVQDTLKALKPIVAEAKKDAILRRWVMTLGVMMLNVGRSISRLIETDDAVSIMILGRSLYEYRIKTVFFLKDKATRRLAYDQYMTTVTAYIEALNKLPTTTADLKAKLDAAQGAWIEAGGKADIQFGKWGTTSMATSLAKPADVFQDGNGIKYTHELRTFYNTPSWFVHGAPGLIAEFFEKWQPHEQGVEDFNLSERPLNHNDVPHNVRGCIADLCMYLYVVRDHYKIQKFDLKLASDKAKKLSPLNAHNT
jgi:hypothetical protein